MTNLKQPVLNPRGSLLIQALIAIGVLGVVTIGFMTMMSNMNSDVSTVNSRVAATGLSQDVRTALTAPGICKAAMAGLSIPVGSRTLQGRAGFGTQGISIGSVGHLKAGEKMTTYSVNIGDVYLTNFLALNGGTTFYLADFVIEPTVQGSNQALRPNSAAKLLLELNASGTVIDCTVDGGSGPAQRCNTPPSPTACTPQYQTVSGGYRVQTNTTCNCSVKYHDGKICYLCTTLSGGGGGGGSGGHGGSGNGHGGLGGSPSDH